MPHGGAGLIEFSFVQGTGPALLDRFCCGLRLTTRAISRGWEPRSELGLTPGRLTEKGR